MIGTRVGHYVVEAQLGAGAMGIVYRAFDSRLERKVAIKVLADVGSSPRARDRILHEARSASALNHPNICTVHEVGEDGDTLYLVMELVEGRSLAALLPGDGLPAETVLTYGIQIAGALAHAHVRGVVHRDLKCTNVVVTPEGQAKVLDFGLAQRMDQFVVSEESETVTSIRDSLLLPGRTAGTLAYMPPEALRGELVDGRADIWALGVMLHEMLTGRLPFDGRTMLELSGLIQHAPPSALPTRVPPGLRAIVGRCLAKETARRYQDAGEVRAALEAVHSSSARGSSAAFVSRQASTARHSLVVLPFANLPADPETDYFADGLTEEIISDLSNIRQLRVISSTSTKQLKGAVHNVADLARQLHINYVLEGSVRRSGHAVRITAKLVEVETDSPIWGNKYSGSLDDVFAIQETISRSIADALRVALTTEEDQKLREHAIADLRAYEWYLRAKQEVLRFTREGLDRGIECLERAEAIAGENVLLLAAKGEAYWQYVNSGVAPDPAYLDKAEACARRILELAPDSPQGRRVAGLVSVHRGDIQGAFRQLKQSLEHAPNDPDSLLWGGLVAGLSGHMAPAEAWAARLVEIDPVTPFFQLMPGTMAWWAGDYERAWTLWSAHQAAVRENPLMRLVHAHLAVLTGRVDLGHRLLDELARALPENPFGQLAGVYYAALTGDRTTAQAKLSPELIAALEGDPQYCWFLAQCHALSGNVDAGLTWLETAVSRGFINSELIAVRDPFLAALRPSPGFAAIVADAERRMHSLDA